MNDHQKAKTFWKIVIAILVVVFFYGLLTMDHARQFAPESPDDELYYPGPRG